MGVSCQRHAPGRALYPRETPSTYCSQNVGRAPTGERCWSTGWGDIWGTYLFLNEIWAHTFLVRNSNTFFAGLSQFSFGVETRRLRHTEWRCCSSSYYFRIILQAKGIIALWASYSFTGLIFIPFPFPHCAKLGILYNLNFSGVY
jgi:hypothetical protein